MESKVERRLELVSHCLDYKDSYIELVEEFRETGEQFVPWVLGFPYEDFSQLLQTLSDSENGIGLKPGFAPHSTFWLVDLNVSKVLGVSNLRHHLTPSLEERGGHIGYGIRPSERRKGYATLILEMTLKDAKRLDLKKVLVTCSKANIGSVKTILKNGAVFSSEEYLEAYSELILRYWIEL